MVDPTESLYKNITLNDVQLASAYYPILIDLAKQKQCITYGELVAKAKRMYPTRKEVQNAIATSTGRKLDVIRIFTAERELPDITSLVINKDTVECGDDFIKYFDPVATREKVFAFDWSNVTTEFDFYIEHTQTIITPKMPISKSQAREKMAAFYKQNKERLPPSVKEHRELIVKLLMEGLTEEEAFSQAISST